MNVCIRVEELAQQLDMEILERGKGVVCFRSAEISRPGLQFTGFYNHFDPHRVQVIGNAEMYYLYSLTENELRERMSRFMETEIPCVVCARGKVPPATVIEYAKKNEVAVFRALCNTDQTGHALNNFIADRLSRHILTHGVLMDIFGVGVLLRGESGVGKSETALEMIRAGQRLVADDVVEVSRIGDRLVGRAPEQIRHFMEVRGIGIVDVRYLYGVGAVLPEKEIDMVIDLKYYDSQEQYLRIGTEETSTVEILGVPLPNTIIPVSPGRNLAIVVEVAARNFRLKRLGYDTGAQFDSNLLR
ncbi:MAG: HPr(Ser) kinase/phosphatase [Candidatus Pelethousia sp.]|nr:HPr(Ser) kinase/phosphatase [Candidatus Pelethousia sp.]